MRAAALAVLACLVLAGCTGPASEPPAPPGPGGAPSGGDGKIAVARPAPGFNPMVKLGTDKGDIYIEVLQDMVPATAANFLGYARSKFYEGTKVHRVVGPAQQPPDGFMIQMGDPNTRDPTKGRDTWGRGDPNLLTIPDEYNLALRHDAAGVVSMANAGPNSGSSQFFITLAPTPWLDNKHAVFGKVAAGMEVVRAIGKVPVIGETPAEDITVRTVEVLEAQRDPAMVRHGIEAWTYHPVINTTQNHSAQFALVVRNTGNVRAPANATLHLPDGWLWDSPCPTPSVTYREQCPFDHNVSAGNGQVWMFRLRTPGNATFGDHRATATFTLGNATAEVPFTIHVGTLGARASTGKQVKVHYTGMLTDGQLFDSSHYALIRDPEVPKVDNIHQPRPPSTYSALDFKLGSGGLIKGFETATSWLREGELGAALMPPAQAYGTQGHALSGRYLVFTIELLEVEDA